jgi:hypothetical protein
VIPKIFPVRTLIYEGGEQYSGIVHGIIDLPVMKLLV